MIIPIRDLQVHGVLADNIDTVLPVNALSYVENVAPFERVLENVRSWETEFGTPTNDPYALFPMRTEDQRYWVSMGLAKAVVFDGSSETDITRTVGGDYTGSSSDRWIGGQFGGVLVVTNGVDDPQQWDGNVLNKTTDLSNWPASTTCKVIRGFKNFLIAGGVTKSSVFYPHLIKWSSPAEAGAVPSSWDETDATQLAGEHTLYESGGSVIDMWPLQDANYIYKEGAIVEMRLVRGEFIWAWRQVSSQLGVFSSNCVKTIRFPNGRVANLVFGSNDVVVHDGVSITPVLNQRRRRDLYNSIDSTSYRCCKLWVDQHRYQAFLSYPESGSTYCNKAVVWNYETNGIGTIELPDISDAQTGWLNPTSTTRTYDTQSQAYDESGLIYDNQPFNPTQYDILMCSPSRGFIYRYNSGTGILELDPVDLEEQRVTKVSVWQRTDWPYVLDRFGNPAVDTKSLKTVRHVYPRFTGGPPRSVSFRFGGRNNDQEPITWGEAINFEPGEGRKLDVWQTWVYPCWEMRVSTLGSFALEALDVDLEISGDFW